MGGTDVRYAGLVSKVDPPIATAGEAATIEARLATGNERLVHRAGTASNYVLQARRQSAWYAMPDLSCLSWRLSLPSYSEAYMFLLSAVSSPSWDGIVPLTSLFFSFLRHRWA